jgi:formate/nitrite transporter FocA (FNT family)
VPAAATWPFWHRQGGADRGPGMRRAGASDRANGRTLARPRGYPRRHEPEHEEAALNEKLFPGRQFISTILEVLEAKSTMSSQLWKIYLMRAAMAGVIISVLYLTYYTVVAGFDAISIGPDQTLKQLGKFLGSFVFGFALVFIYYTKSELLTSNMMIGSIGLYYHRVRFGKVLRLLMMCYLGNFLGGLFVAVLLVGSTVTAGDVGHVMEDTVATKLAYIEAGPSGWSDLFVRAILCNFLINLAMLLCYNGMLTSELAKIIVMVVAVFLFAYLGLEHSVANTAVFLIDGLAYGLDVGAAVANVSIALVGNFIGGGLLIGVYYAYANDEQRMIRRGRVEDEDHILG